MNRIAFTAAAIAAFSISAPASSATLIVDNLGQLAGAKGVDVGGTLYDVEFADGTCVSEFSGCNSVTDFAFSSLASANLASQALLDQVLIDGPQGAFDSIPQLTDGCSGTFCNFFIPYAIGSFGLTPTVQVSAAQNEQFNPTADFDRVITSNITRNRQIDSIGSSTWARFSLASISAVPEPGTWLMLVLGFGAIGASLRNRQQSAKFSVSYS